MKDESLKSFNHCLSVIQKLYDIVKAHGRELIAESRIHAGTAFIIKLVM
jgi:hypothetical protein